MVKNRLINLAMVKAMERRMLIDKVTEADILVAGMVLSRGGKIGGNR